MGRLSVHVALEKNPADQGKMAAITARRGKGQRNPENKGEATRIKRKKVRMKKGRRE